MTSPVPGAQISGVDVAVGQRPEIGGSAPIDGDALGLEAVGKLDEVFDLTAARRGEPAA